MEELSSPSMSGTTAMVQLTACTWSSPLGVFPRACGQQKLEGAGGTSTTEEASKVED